MQGVAYGGGEMPFLFRGGSVLAYEWNQVDGAAQCFFARHFGKAG